MFCRSPKCPAPTGRPHAKSSRPTCFFDPGFSLMRRPMRRTRGLQSAGRIFGQTADRTASGDDGHPGHAPADPALVSTSLYNSLTTPRSIEKCDTRRRRPCWSAPRHRRAPFWAADVSPFKARPSRRCRPRLPNAVLEVTSDNVYERAALSTNMDGETYLRSGMGFQKAQVNSAARAIASPRGHSGLCLCRYARDSRRAPRRFLGLEARGWRASAGLASARILAMQPSSAPWLPIFPPAGPSKSPADLDGVPSRRLVMRQPTVPYSSRSPTTRPLQTLLGGRS